MAKSPDFGPRDRGPKQVLRVRGNSREKPPSTLEIEQDSAEAGYSEKFFEDALFHAIKKYIAEEIYRRRKSPFQVRAKKEFYGLRLYEGILKQILMANEGTEDLESEEAKSFFKDYDYAAAERIWANILEKIRGAIEQAGELKGAGGVSAEAGYAPVIAKPKGVEPDEKRYTEEQLESYKRQRALAEHGIYSAQTPNLAETLGIGPKEGEAPKEADAIDSLKNKMREFLDDFAVHGTEDNSEIDPGTGLPVLRLYSDLDGQSFITLLNKAGFRTNKVKYVKKGEKPKSGLAGDTGGVEGYEILDGGRILIIDHHGAGSGRDSSGTKKLFEGLRDFEFFDPNKVDIKVLEKFVDFVTKKDNDDFSEEERLKSYENYPTSLIALTRFLKADQLLGIFEKYSKDDAEFDPYKPLPSEDLEKMDFWDFKAEKSKKYDYVKGKLEESKRMAEKAIEELVNAGFVIESGGKKILLDFGRQNKKGDWIRKVGMGWPAVKRAGYDTYIIWNKKGNFYAIYTSEDMDFDLPGWVNTRGRYSHFKDEKVAMQMTLQDFLRKVASDPNFELDEKIKAGSEHRRRRDPEVRGLYELLIQKTKINEMAAKIPKEAPAGKEIMWKVWKNSERGAKVSLANMLKKFDPMEVKDLGEKLLPEFLEAYQSARKSLEKGKILTGDRLKKFKEEIFSQMKAGLEYRYEKAEDVELIIKFFKNIFNIEYLLDK